MALGADGKLYILAFDHRGSFQKKMFGIEGDPTPEEVETISDAKRLSFEGMLEAVELGAEWNPLKTFLAGDLERTEAASQVAANYLHFVRIYERQEVH